MPLYEFEGVMPQLPDTGKYWVAPTASVVGNVELGSGASIWYGAVLRGDNEMISVGDNTSIQDNAVAHADMGYPLTVGPGCTIGHQVSLHGCTIGAGTLVGIGATILNGATVGENCIIGAHALIAEGKTIPPRSLVVGAPGRVIRQVSDAEIEGLGEAASHYVKLWRRHSDSLKEVK